MTRLLSLSLLLGIGCNPRVSMQVLEPSLITSPSNIQTLAVVDRSRAKNTGEKILGALESIVTGEGLMADSEGRERAIGAVVTGLRESPRFDAAEVYVPKKELESSLFDKAASWETLEAICRDAGCQGVVALEAFDSDSSVDVEVSEKTETDDNGKEVTVKVFEVDRTTNVVTAWRYYDVVNRQILDDVRDFDRAFSWTESGATEAEARRKLPPQGDAVQYVGDISGREYARRISPTWVTVSRMYYGGGHDQLKLAKNAVRGGNWTAAVDTWDELFNNAADPKTKGRAAFNLALAAEREGDLLNARAWASESATILGNGTSRNYVAELDRRIADQETLRQQMKVTEPGQVGPAKKATAPAKPTKPAPPSNKKPSSSGGGSNR